MLQTLLFLEESTAGDCKNSQRNSQRHIRKSEKMYTMAVKYAPNIYLNIHLNIDLKGRFEGVSESTFGIYWLNLQFTMLDGTFIKAIRVILQMN